MVVNPIYPLIRPEVIKASQARWIPIARAREAERADAYPTGRKVHAIVAASWAALDRRNVRFSGTRAAYRLADRMLAS